MGKGAAAGLKPEKSFRALLPGLGALLALAFVTGIQERIRHEPVTEKLTFKFNERMPTLSPDTAKVVTFGYSRVLSNLLWIRFLQQTPTQKVPPGEFSWIYFDLDTITSIDPDFLPAFEEAGIFLSVVTEDKSGAERLFLKGVRLHPDRWRIRANLGYHYQFELGEEEKAAEQFREASKIPGAPPLMTALAARALAKKEGIMAGILFLEHMMKSTGDEATKRVLQERIEHWKAKLNQAEGK